MLTSENSVTANFGKHGFALVLCGVFIAFS
jgi:hypothetical protein